MPASKRPRACAKEPPRAETVRDLARCLPPRSWPTPTLKAPRRGAFRRDRRSDKRRARAPARPLLPRTPAECALARRRAAPRGWRARRQPAAAPTGSGEPAETVALLDHDRRARSAHARCAHGARADALQTAPRRTPHAPGRERTPNPLGRVEIAAHAAPLPPAGLLFRRVRSRARLSTRKAIPVDQTPPHSPEAAAAREPLRPSVLAPRSALRRGRC